MWIETQKKKVDGKEVITGYKYVERYLDEKTGKYRKTSTTLNAKSPQAKKKATQILNKRIAELTGKVVETKDITFEMAYKAYYKFKRVRWANATAISAESTYRNHIEPYDFKKYLLTAIDLNDVQTLVDIAQFEKNLSQRTALGIKNLIVSVMFFAKKEYKFITPIDFRLLEFKDKAPKSFDGYIDSEVIKDEIIKMRKLLNEVEADLMEFQIHTGMRFGEATAITERDWLFTENKISINKSIDSSDKRKVKSTKNTSSHRIIDSSDRNNEILSRRISFNRVLFGDESNFVFVTRNNVPIAHSNLNKKLKKVNPNYSSHVMRHTHISLLAEQEFPLRYIMHRVGHTDPETTLKIYTHVTERLKNKGAKRLDDLF